MALSESQTKSVHGKGIAMLDHISLSVSDIDKARVFYDKALAALGASRQMSFGEGQGFAASGYGTQPGKPSFWIGATVPPSPITAPPTGHHIAFQASNRAMVNAFYHEAMAAGGLDNGAPGLRPHYHPNYYAAFVIDPDGHHVEAVCHLPE
jgi:catechol 2,3-dioxygenase-like lactoylglutathione lyase family enzyme